MFIGREAELGKLEEMYDSGNFEFAVIYGRRRVGKTTLIREFIKGKKSLFFAASESTATDNLLSLSRCVGGSRAAPVYGDYESTVEAIFAAGEGERLVFVIDEFPYLAEAFRGISSLLQIAIDRHRADSKLMLILCGSSMSFMEHQVLGYKSPLYGRRTAQFKVLPFSFFEALPFFTEYDAADKATLYGMTGGVPEYLTKINVQKSVRENMVDLFFSTSGHFFEEPANLLKQELREPATYNVIIEAIASGASRLNEISTKCKLEANKCAKYLSTLITLGLVNKEYPYGEKPGKRSIYKIADNMFRFWYRFVFPNLSAITAGRGDAVYTHEVAAQLNAYMGLVFEDICRQWLLRREDMPFFVGSAGRWWGTNAKTRSQEEVDLMAVYRNQALFAECKWKNTAVDMDVYAGLKRKSALFSYEQVYLYIFVKGLCSSRLRALHESGQVQIYTLEGMILNENP
ncbi:MAG: ATP-binding protein [Defluviitaleaceae bacterium]|nr:ATP-binding protein [Defluviitaleaceae bacterium]MCL2239164.1 ATP-binding protein [Defluviitaleaceae bacterium]